jgi:hypothetical protein
MNELDLRLPICDFRFQNEVEKQAIGNRHSEIGNVMNKEDLKARTKKFALRVMSLVDALPKTVSGRAIGNQLVRSGTGVGANYIEDVQGRSLLPRLGS